MDRKRLHRNPLIWILAAILVYFTFSVLFDDTRGFKQEPTSVALAQIESGNVREALIEDKEQRLRLTLNQPVDGSTQISLQSQIDEGAYDDHYRCHKQARKEGQSHADGQHQSASPAARRR